MNSNHRMESNFPHDFSIKSKGVRNLCIYIFFYQVSLNLIVPQHKVYLPPKYLTNYGNEPGGKQTVHFINQCGVLKVKVAEIHFRTVILIGYVFCLNFPTTTISSRGTERLESYNQ